MNLLDLDQDDFKKIWHEHLADTYWNKPKNPYEKIVEDVETNELMNHLEEITIFYYDSETKIEYFPSSINIEEPALMIRLFKFPSRTIKRMILSFLGSVGLIIAVANYTGEFAELTVNEIISLLPQYSLLIAILTIVLSILLTIYGDRKEM